MNGLSVLKSNGQNNLEKGIVFLLKYINFLLENSHGVSEPVYIRNLSNEDKQVMSEIKGIQDILIEIGYSWVDDRLYISERANQQHSTVIDYQNELLLLHLDFVLKSIPMTSNCLSPIASGRNRSPNNVQPPWYRQNYIPPGLVMESERVLYAELRKQMGMVLMHEDKAIQAEALKLIPVQRLMATSAVRLANISNDSTESPPIGVLDMVLVELLKWYKEEFFSWINPECPVCKTKCSSSGYATVTDEDRKWQANVVEKHQCTSCGKIVLFPRYNHPAKLLQTRVGRCGEWANCFTLCCRALGYDARLVFDFADHVWTEVYSTSQKRWLHCDPCEGLCDSPLVYEQGWGKQLSYVIAASAREMRDVTFRYVTNWPAVLVRRNRCREPWLISTVNEITKSLQASQNAQSIAELNERFSLEIIDLLTVRSTKENETQGRISGDLGWRLSRNEIKSNVTLGYVFKPSQREIEAKRMHIRYNCSINKYRRILGEGDEIGGWEKGSNKASSVFRKVESDWKQCYLARTEGSQSASIDWVFDVSETDLKIDRVEVIFETKLYETGKVQVTASSELAQSVVVRTGNKFFQMDQHRGSKKLTLSATLSGGSGSVAWQHAQLFRQSLDDKDSWPFEVLITLS